MNAVLPVFQGRSFAEVLEGRCIEAREQVYRLERPDFERVHWQSAELVDPIASRWDVHLPLIDWDAAAFDVGTTADQRMSVVVSWPIDHGAEALRWRPTEHSIGVPPLDLGLRDGRLAIALSAHTISAQDIQRAIYHARRHVIGELERLYVELVAWRPSLRRVVRDAVRKRRELLEGLPSPAGALQ